MPPKFRPSPELRQFADLLRRRMADRGLTIREVAAACEVSIGTIQNYRDARLAPSEAMLAKLVKALGLTGEDRRRFEELAIVAACRPDAQRLIRRLLRRITASRKVVDQG